MEKKEVEIKICFVPNYNKQIPEWRIKQGRITCSKSCAMAWNWTSTRVREKIRGKKYGKRKTKTIIRRYC